LGFRKKELGGTKWRRENVERKREMSIVDPELMMVYNAYLTKKAVKECK